MPYGNVWLSGSPELVAEIAHEGTLQENAQLGREYRVRTLRENPAYCESALRAPPVLEDHRAVVLHIPNGLHLAVTAPAGTRWRDDAKRKLVSWGFLVRIVDNRGCDGGSLAAAGPRGDTRSFHSSRYGAHSSSVDAAHCSSLSSWMNGAF